MATVPPAPATTTAGTKFMDPSEYKAQGVDVKLKSSTESKPDSVFDNGWVKSTFIITGGGSVTGANTDPYQQWIQKNRYGSSASKKFASTSPGMSFGVNCKPQFTRYCDIRDKGRVSSRGDVSTAMSSEPHGLGLGGYYSEAIDDNQQRVFFRFGVPSYMPLPLWVVKAFDIDKAVLQGRGTITSAFLDSVRVVASFLAFVAAPVMFLVTKALGILGSSMRFYSVRPTMYIYWSTVQNILNAMVARRTMMSHTGSDYTYKTNTNTIGTPVAVSSNFVRDLNTLLPDLVDPTTGRVSIYALALRSQKVYNNIKRADMDKSHADKVADAQVRANIDVTPNDTFGKSDTLQGRLVNYLFEKAYDLMVSGNNAEKMDGSMDGSASNAGVMSYSPEFTDANGMPINLSLDPNDSNDSVDAKIKANIENNKGSVYSKYSEYLMAELTEGAAFAVFNVESTGSVGESFSSSFGSNPIESTFNAISAKARNLGSLLSGLKDIPFVGDALELAADTGAVILSAGSGGLANPLLALAYGVNVTMPKIWESSSASLPKSSYKIKLISPYGNAYSQLFNIYTPLAMLLAGSLPRNTGASSYMSPFFCEVFDRGRNNIQLGMISNLGITRGTSNLAFTRAGHPNSIDVDLTVDNLDEIVSVDVTSSGVLTSAVKSITDPIVADTPFVGYMNTLTAVDVYTLAFRLPKIRLKIQEAYMARKAVTDPDPAAFAMMTVENVPFLSLLNIPLGNPVAALQSIGNY